MRLATILPLLLLPLAARAQQTQAVFVGNQGNFSDANGSITVYEPPTGAVTQDAVPDLGTLVQSITLDGDRAYVTSNTAGAVDVFDAVTHARVAQVTGVPDPRYLTVVAPGKAYVSNLFSGTVTVLDLATPSVTGTIAVGANPEDIAVRDGQAFVANFGFGSGSTVSVIDVATDQVVATMDVGCHGPRFLDVDADGDLWVVCAGEVQYNADFTEIVGVVPGEVVVYDAAGAEVARHALARTTGSGAPGTEVFGQDVYYDPLTEQVFVLAGEAVQVFDAATREATAAIPIPGETQSGGIAYDGLFDRLYVGRVTGFTTAGFVSILDRSGTEVARFDAGVIPAAIALYQPGVRVATEAAAPLPGPFRLEAGYPNPFRGATTLPFTLPGAGHVTLRVYDLLGREVATLVDGVRPAGGHTAVWHAGSLPAGLYLARLEAGGRTQTRVLTLLP